MFYNYLIFLSRRKLHQPKLLLAASSFSVAFFIMSMNSSKSISPSPFASISFNASATASLDTKLPRSSPESKATTSSLSILPELSRSNIMNAVLR